jgi:transcription elongation factor Elf1
VTAAWLCQRLIRNSVHDYPEALVVTLLVWRFIAGHFGRRLQNECNRLLSSDQRILSPIASSILKQSHSTAPCPICGGRGAFEYQNKSSVLLRCGTCGHVYACDLPTDKTLHDLYGDFSYWEKDSCHQGITTIEDSAGWQTYLNARIGILEKLRHWNGSQHVKKFSRSVAPKACCYVSLANGMEVAGCGMNRAVAIRNG